MPVPGEARRMNETRPKKMCHRLRMVGASPDLVMVKSAPEEVAVTFPAVMLKFAESRPVLKS